MRIFTSLVSLISILFFLSISSCEVINPAEEIPSYIRIDSVSIIDSTNGNHPVAVNTQKVTDVWVYIDGRLQGVYQLPALFPVLKEGPSKMTFYAGTLDNGIAASRNAYPFFSGYTKIVNLKRAEIDTIKPIVAYDPVATNYSFDEDFESPGQTFKLMPTSTVDTIIKTSEDSLVLHGNYSCLFKLDATHNFLNLENISEYILPYTGVPVYVEMNYRTDVEVEFGMIATNVIDNSVTLIPKLNLFPTSDWKKLYINMTPEITGFKNVKFKIYIKANHNPALTESKILFDDIKLIHR